MLSDRIVGGSGCIDPPAIGENPPFKSHLIGFAFPNFGSPHSEVPELTDPVLAPGAGSGGEDDGGTRLVIDGGGCCAGLGVLVGVNLIMYLPRA